MAAHVELITHVADDLLVHLQCGKCTILSKAGRIAGGVALNGVDGFGDLLRRGSVAQTPAGHRIGLGEAVDGDGVIVDILAQGSDADVLIAAIDQLLIDFVGQDDDAFTDGDVGQCGEFFAGIDGAGRVAGGVQDDHLRHRGHGVLELIRSELPAVFTLRFDDHRNATDDAHHFRVAGPVRSRNDHFITWIHAGKDGIVAGVLGSAVHADLGGFILHLVVHQQLCSDGFTQFEDAGAFGIAGFACVKSFDSSGDDWCRSIEVWLTSSEVQHVNSLLLQRLRLAGDGQGH